MISFFHLDPRNVGSYFPRNEDDAEEDTENYEEPETEAGFKPSEDYPFKEYDAKFGKGRRMHYESAKSDDDNVEDTKVDLAAKYRYQDTVSEGKEEETENESSEGQHYSHSDGPEEEYSTNYEVEGEEEQEEAKGVGISRGKSVDVGKSKAFNKDSDISFEKAFQEMKINNKMSK